MTYKIYKLVSPHTDKIYIGSTCNELRKRYHQHKNNKNNKNTCSSKELFKLGQVKIELIQDNINSKECAIMLESTLIKHYQDLNLCINKAIPNNDRKEWVKNYIKKNKDKFNERQKIWYQKNKDKIKNLYQKNKKIISK